MCRVHARMHGQCRYRGQCRHVASGNAIRRAVVTCLVCMHTCRQKRRLSRAGTSERTSTYPQTRARARARAHTHTHTHTRASGGGGWADDQMPCSASTYRRLYGCRPSSAPRPRPRRCLNTAPGPACPAAAAVAAGERYISCRPVAAAITITSAAVLCCEPGEGMDTPRQGVAGALMRPTAAIHPVAGEPCGGRCDSKTGYSVIINDRIPISVLARLVSCAGGLQGWPEFTLKPEVGFPSCTISGPECTPE